MENRRIMRSYGTVSSLTLASRILGLVRDILTASVFGTSGAISAFFVAFTIPNLFRRLFGEGALSSAFVPQFVKTMNEEGQASAWRLARKIASLLIVVLGGITLVGICLMWGLTQSGLLSEHWVEILSLSQIMLPYMIFICAVALAMGILNSFHHFAIPAAAPIMLNAVWIVTLLFICPLAAPDTSSQVRILAYAVLVAGALQLAVQLPKLHHFGWVPGWDFDIKDLAVKRILLLTLPGAAGAAVTQINVLLDRVIATLAGSYGPSSLNYAERLLYFPMGIFTTALGTILLPILSSHAANGESGKASRTIQGTLRAVALFTVPATVGLMVLAPNLVGLVYKHGQFTDQSAFYVTTALWVYAPLLLFASASKVLIPTFYAHQDTRTPFKVAVIAVLLHLVLSILFFLLLPTQLKHIGPAIGTTAAEVLQLSLLARLFHIRFGNPNWKAILRALGMAAGGSIVMGVSVYFLFEGGQRACAVLGLSHLFSQILVMILTIFVAVAVYGIWLWLFRCDEIQILLRHVQARLGRSAKA